MKCQIRAVLVTTVLAAPVFANDWLVDASGASSSLTTINQAMAVASPGDRILVQPGSYPAFHFSRGVEVIGVGATPSQVVVARVDFHITIPTTGYDAGLSNLTIDSANPLDATSISGNELAGGTFVVDGVSMTGGVYLHGAGQLYVLMNNTHIAAGPGDGFMGAAFDFGGGMLDLVDSWVEAAAADTQFGSLAGIGLRMQGGSTVRISGTRVDGGDATEAFNAAYLNGGDAIAKGFGSGGSNLRISGRSSIKGGSSTASGTPGAGVRVTGAINVAKSLVVGGQGNSPGVAYALSTATQLTYDPRLILDPAHSSASGGSFMLPGTQVSVVADRSLPPTTFGYGIVLDPPSNANTLSPLAIGSTQFLPVGGVKSKVPAAQGNPAPLRRMYYQAFFVDPSTGATVTTNPVAVTIDQ